MTAGDPDGECGSGGSYPVEVIRSARRRKTVQARLVDGVIEVRVPANLAQTEVDEHVRALAARIERKQRSDTIDLTDRALELSKRYELPSPASIRWVANQQHRWGSCTRDDGTIRISDRLTQAPPFVVDYVVLHELTHLVEPNHGPHFHELMQRYSLSERAEGYLLALQTLS